MPEKIGQIHNTDINEINEKLRTAQRLIDDLQVQIDNIKSILNLSYGIITINQEQELENLMEDL